jgi:hypothetical protein
MEITTTSIKRYFGILGVSFVYLLLALPPSLAQQESKITEAKILDLLKSMDEAAIKKDVKAIVAHMAPNAIIKLEMLGPQGKQTLRLNIKEYEAYLKQGYAATSNFNYKRTNTKIKISTDGRTARVTDTVLETMSMGGKTISGETKETALLELRNGKLFITAIDGVIVSMK